MAQPQVDREAWAKWLTAALMSKGWSPERLAGKCKPPVTVSGIYYQLEGKRTPRAVTIMQIEKALGERFRG